MSEISVSHSNLTIKLVCHMPLDSALRATTAAPGYFEEFTSERLPGERQVDGGLLHNNPR
jgi:patatin-like phospholipase/acyl hydrolase